MKWKAALARTSEVLSMQHFSNHTYGMRRVFALLKEGISSAAILADDLDGLIRGRESELNAIRVLSTLSFVTQIQDQPQLPDKHLTKKVDLLVQLQGRRFGAVYVQVKSSEAFIEKFITETMRICDFSTREKAVKQLQKEKIILLNASATRSDEAILADFQQQLREIEWT